MYWTDNQWTVEDVTVPFGDEFQGVSCGSDHSCVSIAVDEGDGGGVYKWDGARWTHSTTPPDLSDIVCTSARSCVGVGFDPFVPARSGGYQEGIVRWNGETWSYELGLSTGNLSNISCSSANACIAVGDGEHDTSIFAES